MRSRKQFTERLVQESLFAPCQLGEAMKRLGFVQADPIRSPARAQDLILRNRVHGYRAGDLEERYPTLDLEESFLYAYGVLTPDLWRAIHPKGEQELTAEQRKVRDLVKREGPMDSKALEAFIGKESARNCWGGSSRAGKLILESLHDRGELRIARREKGIRIYEPANPFQSMSSKEERFQTLILATLQAMGPTTSTFLLAEIAHFRYLIPKAVERRQCLQTLIDAGSIQTDYLDSVPYLSLPWEEKGTQPSETVTLLCPFDPLVRDRSRFEHLWGWKYRFEAYTPRPQRKFGYYAMPILWNNEVIGWANASIREGELQVCFGYVGRQPRGTAYRLAVELEVARLAQFLGLAEGAYQVR